METIKSNSTGIIVILIVIFFWWSFTSDARDKRETLIISSVEKICEEHFKNFDCLGMGFDVASEYKRQAQDTENADRRD